MRKILLSICLLSSLTIFAPQNAQAQKVPDKIENYVEKIFPKTNFRFDGVIILPDNTIYLPLFPAALDENKEELDIKATIPAAKTLKDKPDVVIFNNDFVLMRVIEEKGGKRTLAKMDTLPNEVRTGLLPQDMLIPKGLVLPENLKIIIGNLDISLAQQDDLKTAIKKTASDNTFKPLSALPELKDKTLYIATCYNKNIQVVNQENKTPDYALLQKHIPITIKGTPDGKFLLVTSYDKKTIDVISLVDDQVIKRIEFSSQPEEILIDKDNNIAYISSPLAHSIFIVNLQTMTLSKQIKVNGMCEKLTLSDDGKKLFYFDKNTHEIWGIELDNRYLLKDVGKFPNVSKIVLANNKVYIASRTKSRLAIVDYDTIGLIAEIDITEKPIDMVVSGDNLFILGATQNVIQVLDVQTDMITDSIYLNTKGFSTKISPIEGTDLALVTDTTAGMYSVLNMKTKQVIKTNPLETPVSSVVVIDKVQKINK